MKENRISVIQKTEEGLSDYQCDLCDETNYPMISWACTHDDDYIRTIICLACIHNLKIGASEMALVNFFVEEIKENVADKTHVYMCLCGIEKCAKELLHSVEVQKKNLNLDYLEK